MPSAPPRRVSTRKRLISRLTGGGMALLLTGSFTPAAHAAGTTTLYVGGSGCSETATGAGSQTQPFCTIGRALSGITAGTTVLVNPGTYNESVTVAASGASGSPITIEAASPGTATVSGGAHGFSVSGQHYVTISGFTITGTSAEGISLTNSDHLVVTGNTVTQSGHQVSGQNAAGVKLTGVTASQINANHSDHNSFYGFLLDTGTSGVTVSGNEASFNAEGWQRNANGIDVVSTGNYIIGNTLHDNEDSGLQFYPGGDHNLAANNISYNNGDHGIDDLNVTGNTLIGNTVYNNCTDGINVEGTSSNYIVENNISMDNAVNTNCAHGPVGKDGRGRAGEIGIYDSAATGTIVDYNLVYSTSGTDQLYQWGPTVYTSLAAFRTGSGQGIHDLSANPKFTSTAAGDFHLTAGSPGIDSADSGVGGWQNADADGNTRVDDPNTPDTGIGPRIFDDRGAYEFQTAAQPVLAARLSLNPVSGTAPASVTADASASTAGVAPIADYTFDFGDGSSTAVVGPQAGSTASHVYNGPGTYTVTVTVRDAAGATQIATQNVAVTAPVNPTAALTVSPDTGTAPLTVTADGSGSTAGTASITSYSFDFGDGSPIQSGTATTAGYTYTRAGTYTLTLTVKDAAGLTATATKTITVSAQVTPISYAGRPASEALVVTNMGTTIPVTTATHAGDALIVSVYLTSATAGTVTAADSGHNTYRVVSDITDSSKHRTLVLAAFATNALTTTDTITFTWPGASKHNITVDEFAGLQAVDQQTTASGPAGGTTFTTGTLTTTGSAELLFSAVGTNTGTAPTFNTGWTPLAPLALSSYRITSAYDIVAPGAYSASGTTTAQWATALVAFK